MTTTPTAGTAGPLTPAAGSQAPRAGSTAVGGAGAGGATGTSTSGVSTAGTNAAASGSGGAGTAVAGAPAGTGAAGATGAAGGSAAAGKGGSIAAGATATAGNAAAGGCGSESFAAIYESILKNTTYNCAGPLCHGRETAMAMPVGNLSLSSADVAYMQLVKVDSTGMACSGMPRVVPGDPEGTTTCGGVMPVGADEISEADLKRVTDWISGGACDN
jgi:hypothetical protein